MNASKLVLALGLTLALGALPSCRSNEDPTPTPTPKPQSGIVIKNGVLSAYPEKEIKDGTVSLPEVTTINAKVFEGYKTLKKVEAPKLAKVEAAAFKGCTALTSLTLGSTIPVVADDAFEGTPDTKDLIVPAEKAKEYRAFATKHHFKTINGQPIPTILIEAGVLKVYPAELLPEDGKLTLAENITSIADEVFADQTQLKEVHATHVTKIGAKAFKGCSALSTVELGETVPTVADDAFEGTPDTKNLVVPAEKVADYLAFAKKHHFKTINGEEPIDLPAGVVIEGNTLKKWPASVARQEKVVLPSYITKIGMGAFERGTQVIELVGPGVEEIAMKGFGTQGTSKLRKATFPKLKKIGERGVFSCDALTTFEAPLLEEVGVGAFLKSSKITEFNFPLLKKAPTDAFRAGFQGDLKKIVLPAVTSFGENVFNFHNKVESIELGATPPSGSVQTLFDSALKSKNPAPKVIVPASAVDAYGGLGNKWLGIFVVEAKKP
nr:leucine-rich repeat protein [uncultured Porphyromonas sp.]